MSALNSDHSRRPTQDRLHWLEADVAEVSLVLPGWQAAELEGLASSLGLTVGQLLRRLIQEYLTSLQAPRTGSKQV
jgi:hypothetical protein